MARIVVIDDDADIRELVEMKLTRMGHEVHLARNGTDGLARCLALRPDLAVVDVNMPGLTGLEVVAALRSDHDAGVRETPVVLLTAMATAADVDAGRCAGADDYLTKPFSPATLAERVEALLGQGDMVG